MVSSLDATKVLCIFLLKFLSSGVSLYVLDQEILWLKWNSHPVQARLMSLNVGDSYVLLALLSKLWPVFAHLFIVVEKTLVFHEGEHYGAKRLTGTIYRYQRFLVKLWI